MCQLTDLVLMVFFHSVSSVPPFSYAGGRNQNTAGHHLSLPTAVKHATQFTYTLSTRTPENRYARMALDAGNARIMGVGLNTIFRHLKTQPHR